MMSDKVHREALESISRNAGGNCSFDKRLGRVVCGRFIIPLATFFALRNQGLLIFFGDTGYEEVWMLSSKGKRYLASSD